MLMFTIGKITRQMKWLPFVIFLLFLCGMQVTEAQTSGDPHRQWHEVPHLADFSVQFFTRDATCYDNGQVGFILVHVDQNDSTPIDQTALDTLMLESFGIGQKGTLLDTTMHWHRDLTYIPGDTVWVVIDPGTSLITLEFTHRHGALDYWIVDTTVTLTVNLLYKEPEISALGVISYNGTDLGNIPSLDCDSTGRIQLRIKNGQYPYTIKYCQHDSQDTLTAVFNNYQHSGTDSSKSDFQDYFSFENLCAGQWDFYMEDNCGYKMPRVSQQIGSVPLPNLERIDIYASSGNIADINAVRINAVFNNEYNYYEQLYQPHMQYCFVVDSLQTTAQWKDFPVTGQKTVTLIESIPRAQNYCEIHDKNIQFKLKLLQDMPSTYCPTYDTAITFQIRKPNASYFRPNGSKNVIDSVVYLGTCGSTVYIHTDSNHIAYQTNQPDHVNPNNDHNYIRYHFTYPIVWSYINYNDMTDTLLHDTIVNNIAKTTYFARQNWLDKHPTQTGPQQIVRELKDANGCLLYRDNFRITVQNSHYSTSSPNWKVDATEPVCCTQKRSITLSEEFSKPGENYDGLTIRLVDGPEDNLYGFTATFNSLTKWTVQKDNGYLNQASFTYTPDGSKLVMSKNCLPSGTYTFEITNAPCHEGETLTVQKYLSETVYPAFLEEPVFQLKPGCSEAFYKCTQGQIAIVKEYRPETDNLDQLITETTPLETFIRMVAGPIGGYSATDVTEYHIGDTIRITVPSDSAHPYIFKLYTHADIDDICEDFYRYDTVYYDGATVKFDFAMGLVCDTSYSKGTVYIRAKNGNPPYHYLVYDQPDLQGNLIGDVTLGKDAVAQFDEVMMKTSRQLSCEVSDSCGSAFRINFYPQSLAELQKTWFDGGKTTVETCEGTTVTIHALQAGLIFSYKWFIGDDTIPAWTSSDPSVFIPRGADTAVYRVEIGQTGCQSVLTDSVTVYPLVAPYLQINGSPDILVCPGDSADITFIPHSDINGDVKFDLYFDNMAGRTVQHYGPVPSGSPITIRYSSPFNTKIYPKNIQDAQCDYGLADPGDTIHFNIDNNNVNPCQIVTTDQTVCLYEDATLSARSTAAPPFTLRWFGDYSLTDTLETVFLTSDQTVYYYLDSLDRYTNLFVTVEKPGLCPANNTVANNSVNMAVTDTTTLICTDSYYFYDNGGIQGDYSTEEPVYQHMFVSTADGLPVTMHFTSLDLSPTSYLFVFSGSQAITDSMLISMEEGSIPPDFVISNSDTMLVVFMPGSIPAKGWSAVVKPAPGVAIADIYKRPYNLLKDKVCQNHRTGHDCYDDQYNFIGDSTQLWTKVEHDVQTAGTYVYEKKGKTTDGCDSITALVLEVTLPKYSVSNEMVLSLDTPYVWNGLNCSTTGRYTTTLSESDGCDSLAILNLVVLNVDTSTNNICESGSTNMGIKVYTPDMKFYYPRISVGDVLCTDGSVIRVDSFLNTNKVAMGVVFYIEPNDPYHQHGRALALYDAYGDQCDWTPNSKCNGTSLTNLVHSATQITPPSGKLPHIPAMMDLNGYDNSMTILATAASVGCGSEQVNAPACYYCFYYDHLTHTTGSVHKGWYMPALGELNLIYANRFEVRKTLQILKSLNMAELMRDDHFGTWDNVTFPDTKYWSSTESYVGTTYAAYCFSSNGQLNNKNNKYKDIKNPRYVRAVISF